MSRFYSNFFSAIKNLFFFLPYFFSISTLFRTLFSPWKNITDTDKTVGFSFENVMNKLSFNLISRFIGFIMRSSIIFFFVLIYILFVISFPLIFILFTVTIPLQLLFSSFQESPEQQQSTAREQFVRAHTMHSQNAQAVSEWFNRVYEDFVQDKPWWDRQRLFAIPPLGRDWTMGFTPILDQYAEDLTTEDYLQNVHHVVGREAELKTLQTLLSKSLESNAILVGDDGIGKDSIIDALAKIVHEGKANSILNYKRILRVNMERISAEFSDPKRREDFFEKLLEEASRSKSAILVIEGIDRYLHSGEGYIDLTVPLIKYAKRSSLQVLGTTSPYLYDKFVVPQAGVSRLFTRIDVDQLNEQETMSVLEYLALSFEQRYQISIPFEALQTVVEKSSFYITNIPFPEKAIQLLDNACAYAKENKIQKLDPNIVETVLTSKTHVPTSVNEKMKKLLLDFEATISTRILGQPEAVKELGSALRRSFIELGKRKKPLATFLLLGPTGTGKTETAKAIAQVFFGDSTHMIRFDMSEYQNIDDIQKLIGSAKDNEPGLLTTAIRNQPYGVLLLDELEKAHKNLLNIFLTVLDEGYFTDGLGKTIDCKNLIIVATSNAGAEEIFKSIQADQAATLTTESMMSSLITKGIFSPEFLNRFDGVVLYKPLSRQTLVFIARKMVDSITKTFELSHQIHVNVSDEFLQNIIQQSYHPEFGARNMQRVITEQIEDVVAKQILANDTKPGDTITLTK